MLKKAVVKASEADVKASDVKASEVLASLLAEHDVVGARAQLKPL